MPFSSLEDALLFLEKNGQLIRVKEEVDPYLEMAAIHLRMYQKKGPALLFENVKGTRYRCASNIFGSLERSKLLFAKNLATVGALIEFKNDPMKSLKTPLKSLPTLLSGLNALPKKSFSSVSSVFDEIKISDLPLIQHWPMDGGAFVTLPQVYTEDVETPGVMKSNLGMYRIQLSGNDYELDKEIGLHYQLHRGIGVHQTKANAKGESLKVCVFVGGPPSHTVAAVMPLPEGLSELQFAGILGGRRFRYKNEEGFIISMDADFVITGEVYPKENKPEGPFGDHLGYYSLRHDFPLMKVKKVYAKKNAIWAFTVVGRPPQEDTSFGELIHEMTGDAVQSEVPGLIELNAVDAAGVHPLLIAIGSERYTPYAESEQPAELLTIANRMLGTGQLSLAKFLFICSGNRDEVSTHNIPAYFQYVLARINLKRDIHFYTNTSMDTLDYSGDGLNTGSKVVIAAHGKPIRALSDSTGDIFLNKKGILKATLVMNGVVAIQLAKGFNNYTDTKMEMEELSSALLPYLKLLQSLPLIVICDDADFLENNVQNFLWVTFTRSNPSHDIYGVDAFTTNKHWGCNGSLIIDARKKPHHAPELILNEKVLEKIAPIFAEGGSLAGW